MTAAVALSGGCAGSPPSPDIPPHPGDDRNDDGVQVLVAYEKSGGIAGFQDQLVVWRDGATSVTVFDRTRSFRLPAHDLSLLRRMLRQVELSELETDGSLDVEGPDTEVHAYLTAEGTTVDVAALADDAGPKDYHEGARLLDRILRREGRVNAICVRQVDADCVDPEVPRLDSERNPFPVSGSRLR